MSTGFSTFDVGGCGCPTGIPCDPCDIPADNITLSWTSTGGAGKLPSGSATLTYTAGGSPPWIALPITLGGGLGPQFQFSALCSGGTLTEIDVSRYDYDGVLGYYALTYFERFYVGLGTCSPYHLSYTISNVADATLWIDGFRSFFLDYP